MTTKAMAVPIAEQPKKASDFASVAANLANANRKVVQPQPPRHDKFIPHIHTYGRSNPTNIPPVRPLSSNISIASSKAALLAHQGAQQPASQKAPVSAPPKYSVDSRAAAAATKSWNTPQASAAATALNTSCDKSMGRPNNTHEPSSRGPIEFPRSSNDSTQD